MIRFLTPEEQTQLKPEDIIGKYIFQINDFENAGRHWTATEYPRYVGGILDDETVSSFKENPSRNILTGEGEMKPCEATTVKYVKCICDTADDVNTLRDLGSTILQEANDFWDNVKVKFEKFGALYRDDEIIIGEQENVTGDQILNKYVFLNESRWTAERYPKYVEDFRPGRNGASGYFKGSDECPSLYGDITGRDQRDNTKEFQMDKIVCICSSPEHVMSVMEFGQNIRNDITSFWLETKKRFKELDTRQENISSPKF